MWVGNKKAWLYECCLLWSFDGVFCLVKIIHKLKTKCIWEDGMPISIAAASPLWIRAICKILSLVLSSGAWLSSNGMTTRLWYDDLIAGFDSKLVDRDVGIISEEQRLVGLLVGLLMIMDSGIGHCLITYFRLRWC